MFGNNLKRIRKTKNLTMDEAVENINRKYEGVVHINKGNLSKWENDKSEPMLSTVRVLADFYNLSVDDIVSGNFRDEGKPSLSSINNQLEPPRQTKVYNYAEHELEEQNKVNEPTEIIEIHSKLSAGTGVIDLDPYYIDELEYSGYVPKHDLAFIVDGHSMEPTFENEEIVFVERTPDIRSGQFVAVQVNEEAYIKKYYKADDHIRLVSLNQEYDDIYADENDDIRIVGRVIL